MGLKDRLRRLEGKGPPKGCPACGGKIIIGEEQDDGTVVWDGDGPCEECGSSAAHPEQITRIVVKYDPPIAGEEDDPVWPQ